MLLDKGVAMRHVIWTSDDKRGVAALAVLGMWLMVAVVTGPATSTTASAGDGSIITERQIVAMQGQWVRRGGFWQYEAIKDTAKAPQATASIAPSDQPKTVSPTGRWQKIDGLWQWRKAPAEKWISSGKGWLRSRANADLIYL